MPKTDSKIEKVIDLLKRITNGEKLTDIETKVIENYEPLSTSNRWKIIYHVLDTVLINISQSVDENNIPDKNTTRFLNSLLHAADRRETTYSTTADYKDGISISFDYSVPTLQQSDDDNAET